MHARTWTTLAAMTLVCSFSHGRTVRAQTPPKPTNSPAWFVGSESKGLSQNSKGVLVRDGHDLAIKVESDLYAAAEARKGQSKKRTGIAALT